MSNLTGKVALVTGSEGFIGKHLCAALEKLNATVVKFDLQHGDFSKSEDFDKVFTKQNVDYVFHLAGQKNATIAKKNPKDTLNLALQGTLNVLEAARIQQNVKKVVLISH